MEKVTYRYTFSVPKTIVRRARDAELSMIPSMKRKKEYNQVREVSGTFT